MSDRTSQLLPSALIAACQPRRKRLCAALAEQELDAILISNEKDIQYLTGFVGHDSLLIIMQQADPAGAIIISDSRYDEFLDPWREAKIVEVVMGTRHWLHKSVQNTCESLSISRLGIQAEHMTIAGREMFAHFLGAARLADTQGLVSSLRMRKDDLEVATIEWAISVQQDSLASALERLAIGMKELEFSALLEFEMKTRGAYGASFPPIIGAGPNSSIIHHMTGATTIQPGLLLIDWGALIDGYCSDLTRTFCLGAMPEKVREVYRIVLEAQQAAIDHIAPGKICADIDEVARKIITEAGYGEHFGHGLGHGLGMDVHEMPFFNNLEKNTTLTPGMVMTVEPGIYLPGIGGVRIEDDVLVTDDGCRVLSDWPRDLDSAVIEPAMTGSRR